jgi:hypothetical protein
MRLHPIAKRVLLVFSLLGLLAMTGCSAVGTPSANSMSATPADSTMEPAEAEPGPQGLKGDMGDTGPVGPEGPRGPAGARGEIGYTGPPGAVGPRGPAGARGEAGATGPAGPRGYITELSVCGSSGNELCKIGMIGPGGGFVFFIDYMDQFPSFCAVGECNYLEASPADASDGIEWCSNTDTLLGLDGWDKGAIGVGRINTIRMLDTTQAAHCTTGAAVVAFNYTVSGGVEAGGWWLPSLGELIEMEANLRTAGVGDFQRGGGYWSSSEGDATNGCLLFVTPGGVDCGMISAKDRTWLVRPVRGF